jgi:hypothetical protein
MPDYFIFENWPYEYPKGYWGNYEKQKKLAIERWRLITMVELFPSASKTEIAQKLGIALAEYWRLRKKHNLI